MSAYISKFLIDLDRNKRSTKTLKNCHFTFSSLYHFESSVSLVRDFLFTCIFMSHEGHMFWLLRVILVILSVLRECGRMFIFKSVVSCILMLRLGGQGGH